MGFDHPVHEFESEKLLNKMSYLLHEWSGSFAPLKCMLMKMPFVKETDQRNFKVIRTGIERVSGGEGEGIPFLYLYYD